MAARLKAEKVQKPGKARAKAKANATNQKAAKSSSSSGTTTSSSTEGEQPPANMKVNSKGKEHTQKAPAKATPKSLSAAKPKGKRTLAETAEEAMLPPQSTPVGRVKLQPSRMKACKS